MMRIMPYRTVKHAGLTIEGLSLAGVQTYWRIPELKIGFDLGGCPWQFLPTPNWFISHTHLDHISMLPLLVGRRYFLGQTPPTIYMPHEAIRPVETILAQYRKLDRGRYEANLVGVEPGDEIRIGRELIVEVVEVDHYPVGLGYIAWNVRRKLREEFQHLSQDEIRNLAVSGTEVSHEIRRPQIAYLGDTSPRGLDRNPTMFEAQILIAEMTFLSEDDDDTLAILAKRRHMHLRHFIERREKFKNELIIASHISTRYHPKQAAAIVEQALPDMLDGRLKLIM